MRSTPSFFNRVLAIFAFSGGVNETPCVCSPSLKVVSINLILFAEEDMLCVLLFEKEQEKCCRLFSGKFMQDQTSGQHESQSQMYFTRKIKHIRSVKQ